VRLPHWLKLPDEPHGLLFSGLTGLFASLLMWRLTHSELGWLALFLPGGVLVILGWVVIFRNINH
jgi:hypothetical protein